MSEPRPKIWEMGKDETGKILWYKPWRFKCKWAVGQGFVYDSKTYQVIACDLKCEILHTVIREIV